MFIRLSDTPNRAVLYDLYPYIWDVKEVVLLLDSFVNWLGKLFLYLKGREETVETVIEMRYVF